MDKRTNESPMDFEWQSGRGPVDKNSSFMRNINNSQSQHAMLGQKRTFSSFDSPQKPQTPWREPGTPSTPSLFSLPPASTSTIFPSPSPSKPMTDYFRKPSFTTPRQIMVDFSSGPENLSSPENADNDDTPEKPRQDGITLTKTDGTMQYFTGNKTTEKKERALGLFSKYTTPGRGEIPRGKHSDAIARRVHKRRRHDPPRDNRLAPRRSSSDSDSEPHSRPSSRESASKQPRPPPPSEAGLIPSVLHFLETHPRLPHILSLYAQYFFNLFLMLVCVYAIYAFWSTVRSDVDRKSEEEASVSAAEIAVCAKHYLDNQCSPPQRVPALAAVCESWERCMNRDPDAVGRARVSARTFAEILNSFVEPISYKTLIFILTPILGCFAISNLAFGFFRNRPPPPPQMAYMQPPPPAHPAQMRYPGGNHYQYGNHAVDVPWQAIEGDRTMQTPLKRVGYR
ncbi:Brl1/Brr6 domain [Lasallia pustulata]|uniref:Brl1/Brr6 domain n=1 Tax=Lasallia pustulata TaxID=136370 RepID=A0A1W5D689_9LECA|nr:Brl1/Brr6 domain [Lasallia pustulata]